MMCSHRFLSGEWCQGPSQHPGQHSPSHRYWENNQTTPAAAVVVEAAAVEIENAAAGVGRCITINGLKWTEVISGDCSAMVSDRPASPAEAAAMRGWLMNEWGLQA